MIPESYEICRLMVTNETSYDAVVLTKDTGVIRGLPIDGEISGRRKDFMINFHEGVGLQCVSNPEPLTLRSDALPTTLRSPEN